MVSKVSFKQGCDKMIKSMTGYGRSEVLLPAGKMTIEIRSVNGKGADISIKSQLLPRDKEIGMRTRLAEVLKRGTIDMFVTWEPSAGRNSQRIDADVAAAYCSQVRSLCAGLGISADDAVLLDSVLRMPGVMDVAHADVVTEENWPLVEKCFEEALRAIDEYRSKEGEALYADVCSRVDAILALSREVEACEAARLDAVRARLLKALDELKVKFDESRFEQELIFYIEKLDINEERVRLRQHCKYFKDTIDNEACPGKKLGFIIQEMGREINTTGSKANYAPIQRCVVRMKDELEKVREQSMNIL